MSPTVKNWVPLWSWLALIAVLCGNQKAAAYEEDFHYYSVYLILRSRGYNASLAHQFAGFSQYIDDNGATEPIYCWSSVRAKHHFIGSKPHTATTQDNAEAVKSVVDAFELFRTGDARAKFLVGHALHGYADTFSHSGFTAWFEWAINRREGSWRPRFGHADTAEDGHAPDRPYNDVTKAILAASRIYNLVPVSGESPVVPWEVIEKALIPVYDYSEAKVKQPSVELRIGQLKQAIHTLLHESTSYEKGEFARERKAFESAVAN